MDATALTDAEVVARQEVARYLRFGFNPQLRDDLEQSAMEKCVKAARMWRPETGVPRTVYLRIAVRRRLREEVSRSLTIVRVPDGHLEEARNLQGRASLDEADGPDGRPTAEEALLAREQDEALSRWRARVRAELRAAAAGLAPDSQRAAMAVLIDQEPPAQVAEALGLSRQSVYAAVMRLRSRLSRSARLAALWAQRHTL